MSGAARRLASGNPSIALSGRHLVEDHLWFTFFHEAAHLVLHDDKATYIDEIEAGSSIAEAQQEADADDYAGRLLVPAEYEGRLRAVRYKPVEIRKLAHEVGVSTGVVVGQMQHRGLMSHGTKYNHLKRRYKWVGSTLERK